MDNTKEFALDILFPKFCFGCKTEGVYLCEDCRGLLDILEHHYCLCDKKHFHIPADSKTGKCSTCRDKKLSGLYFALPYKNPVVKKLIYQFKYEPYISDLAPVLSSLIVEHLVRTRKNTEAIWENAVLIPIPLDHKKIKRRGYNQSSLLAGELGQAISVPQVTDVLVKTRVTGSQMELSKEEREKNLQGAFEIKNPELISGKIIFLVDDVYTTGSTMEACASILLKAGAKSVWGIALAREE